MIVVATEDFELYHEIVDELRDRGVTFTTVEPGEELPERTTVVITAPGEAVSSGAEQVTTTAAHARRAVEESLALLRSDGGRIIIGIDPGTSPGIAVLAGDTVVAAFQVPLAEATETVSREVADATNPLVRIGDGARLQGAQVINDLDDLFELPCFANIDERLQKKGPTRKELYSLVRLVAWLQEYRIDKTETELIEDLKDLLSRWPWYDEQTSDYQIRYELEKGEIDGRSPLPIGCNNDDMQM